MQTERVELCLDVFQVRRFFMRAKNKLVKTGKFLLDVLEIHLPSLLFMTLFICFLIGIVCRYILKDPQAWTFEMSTICYLWVAVLSWGIAHRMDDNVVFDMLYNKLSPTVQCLLRLISNLLIAVTAAVLIGPSLEYLESLFGLTTQTIKLPRFLVFVPFTVSFISATVRSIYNFVLDICSIKDKTYKQKYGKTEEKVA